MLAVMENDVAVRDFARCLTGSDWICILYLASRGKRGSGSEVFVETIFII